MSKIKTWQFSNNQFLNVTKKNYRKALKLSSAHDKYLFKKTTDFPADPDWATLYERYHPVHLAYMAAYTNWKASGGNLSGDTQSLNDLLKLIPKKLDHWIALIIPVYDRATAQFKKFFPQGRTPFEVGRIDDKITAVKSLSTTIGADVTIAPAKVLVDAAYAELDGARSTQEGGKSSKKTLSEAVEAGRVSAMTMQYRDAGFLINKYADTPQSIESVFDLLTLRENLQSFFTRKMKPTENSPLTKNTFAADDDIRAKVADAGSSTDKVTLYLGSTLGGIDSTGITVFNNAGVKFAASAFNVDLTVNTFLTAVTNGNIETVKLAVELY